MATTSAAPTRVGKSPRKAKPASPAPAVTEAAAPVPTAPTTKAAKAPKPKLVRDSFTIPQLEYDQLSALKRRALGLAHHAKKSELLRAGIAVLAAMDDASLLSALQAVPPLKTGRPKSEAAAEPAPASTEAAPVADTADSTPVPPEAAPEVAAAPARRARKTSKAVKPAKVEQAG